MKNRIYSKLIIITYLITFQLQGQTNKGTLISLRNITVSPERISHPGSGIENIADGKRDVDHMFHTRWGGIPKTNITIEAAMKGKRKRLDKIILSPRSSGLNGIIKSAKLFIFSKGKYRYIDTIEGTLSNSPIQFELESPIKNPKKIKLVITDSYADRNSDLYMVSLSELECVMLPVGTITRSKVVKDAKLFSNLEGTSLKINVKKNDIEKMKVPTLKKLANEIYNNNYNPESLISNYQPYLNPKILGQQMRIGDGYSKYEGITGVILDKGENIIFLGESNGAKIRLLVPNWTRKPPPGIQADKDPLGWGLVNDEFILKEGVNFVNLEKGGNVYVQYFVDNNPNDYNPITVHFPTGVFNGYFDLVRGDTNEDFDKLLKTSISPILDMRGKHIQVAYPVEDLKKYTLGKGIELINNYDTIIKLQRFLSGWDKEGFNPKNRILARVNYQYYMFRDHDGVAYKKDAMKLVTIPNSVITGDPCWGFSHEAGHVHQMRPQMTWGGMAEVSNNIFTMYCHTTLGNTSRLLRQNVYSKARESILDKNISYLDNSDVFQRLIPFWQLHLYFKNEGYLDFYPDLMIAMRKQEPMAKVNRDKDYLNMLEFCRLACEVSKTDLTEFFQRWGFFYVGEVDVSDYSSYNYKIKKSDIDFIKDAIAKMNLPKPKIDITLMED